jgi:N-acetylmannosamine-6-phosphate 2-epimerase / N-acetylmannosamine kinase
MARFAQAAALGGAVGIRANGPSDIAAVRQAVRLPVIGIQKRTQSDGKVLITPSFEDALGLVQAGAQIVAVECTARGMKFGALDLVRRIRTELGVLVMADIATLDEAIAAEQAGADLLASTMRGYTPDTEQIQSFQPSFIAALVAHLKIPVLAEGRVDTPQQAAEAFGAGAHAVIVGTAITRPEVITARFVTALATEKARKESAPVVGIDLGGTNTKAAILSPEGRLQFQSVVPTPAESRAALLAHLIKVGTEQLNQAQRAGTPAKALGIATAGWADPNTGQVLFATQNLPGWTGTHLAEELEHALKLPVAIENDVNALAIAERHFGAGRGVDDFVCMTLGTGVGGGCYSGGRLIRGAHYFANAIGHMAIQFSGELCSCGLRGCLESYTSAAALLRYAKGQYSSAEQVIQAAHAGAPIARSALKEYADYLAVGIASIVNLLDPEVLILAGGIARQNEILLKDLNTLLPQLIMAAKMRRLRIFPSQLGYYGAVFGAGVIAREKLH